MPTEEGELSRVHLNSDEPDDPYPLYGLGPVPKKEPGVVRIWVDGCFDMLHFGHTNAIRQAAQLGTELFVGNHSDDEVIRFKGPSIMKDEERYEALRACKWVTYVVENYPYVTRLKDMDRFDIDFVVHGNDISTDLDGRNSYQEIMDAGRFKVIRRTDGVSTTDLVGRMLLCTKQHHTATPPPEGEPEIDKSVPREHFGRTSLRYLTTSRKIVQFSNNSAPKPDDTVVYVDGSFDCFHIGHMSVLKKARKFGTYVIAGIHEDAVINQNKGSNFPIMNLHERVLGVLSCRYVDDVVMGVPFNVSEELIEALGIHVVVAGSTMDPYKDKDYDPYEVPRKKGIFRRVESGCSLTIEALIQRIVDNRREYERRQREKTTKDKKLKDSLPEELRKIQEL